MNNNVTRALLLGLCLATGVAARAQQDDKGTRVILNASRGMTGATMHVYQPPFEARAIYRDTTEAVNRYPEQVMSSIMSTTSQEWIDYNTLGGNARSDRKRQPYFDYIRTMDRTKNFFTLRSKLTFTLQGHTYAIVKFYITSQEITKPQSGAYVLEQVGSRWYLTSGPATADMSLLMMRFQEEKLARLLQGQDDGNPLMKDLLRRVAPDGSVNFSRLYQEMTEWYENNETDKLNYFIDKDAW